MNVGTVEMTLIFYHSYQYYGIAYNLFTLTYMASCTVEPLKTMDILEPVN